MAEPDPLSVLLRNAAGGRFPPPDGTVRVLASPPGPVDAVVAFTAHNVIAADVDQGEILQHDLRTDRPVPRGEEGPYRGDVSRADLGEQELAGWRHPRGGTSEP